MSRSASYERDGTVSVHLHMAHYYHLQEMTYVQRICRRVKAYIKGHLLLAQKLSYFLLMRTLRYKSTLLKYVKHIFRHRSPPLFLVHRCGVTII